VVALLSGEVFIAGEGRAMASPKNLSDLKNKSQGREGMPCLMEIEKRYPAGGSSLMRLEIK
jgi:hypothetical protein